MKEKLKKDPSAEAFEGPDAQELGKDELNLAEFPIALLSEKAPQGVRTLEFKDQIFDSGKRKLLNRRLTIEGSETYGLPTAKDDEVILGLIQLSKRKRFRDKALHFTRFELITLLGWPNTGQSYARVELALRRWVSVTLHYENAWWDKNEERWTSGAFHIIDDFELNDSRETTSQLTLLTSRIIWSSRVFGSFVEGHLKNIRYDVYVKLRSAVSKRMFRFLDKRFHHTKVCAFDLRDFAHEHIGLSRSYKDCGKLKEKLNAGIKELEEIGFLDPMAGEERYHHEGRGRWKVNFRRSGTKTPPPPPLLAEATELPASSLAAELVARGVTTKTAGELVECHPAEEIAVKLEVFDWLTEKQDKRIAKSPAGYLVKSIQDGFAVPKGFIPKAERVQREEAKAVKAREAAESEQRKRAQTAREQREDEAVTAYRRAMTKEQLQAFEAEALALASGEERELHAGAMKSLRRIVLARIVDERIRRILSGQAAEG